ncbi:MAG TPA: DEAD/DEAH box helicase, partial [Beutenbergiaceae bacterium]|nr:DEAD/DEAH box helicase [Beutenbergiaceae bacterium]
MVHPLVSLLRAHSSQFHPDHDPVVDQRVLPEHPGRQHPWPHWVPTTIRDGFRHARGVDQPWGHQVEAWRVLQAGKHLALATPTGSGKSLIAWVPILTEILKP